MRDSKQVNHFLVNVVIKLRRLTSCVHDYPVLNIRGGDKQPFDIGHLKSKISGKFLYFLAIGACHIQRRERFGRQFVGFNKGGSRGH